MFNKGYKIVEIVIVLITVWFLCKLYFYKEHLTNKIIEKNYGLLKEAWLILNEPDYFYYLIGGILVLIILIGFVYYCIKYEEDRGLILILVVVLNIMLSIIVLLVFWSPILTTLLVLGVVGLLLVMSIG